METLGKIAKRVIPYLVAIIVELYLTVLIVGSLLALKDYKLEIGNHYSAIIKDLAMHPFAYGTQYFNDRNPLFIVLAVASVLYTLFLAIKWQHNKKKNWETAETDTHGSASWGNTKELMNEYFKVSPHNLSEMLDKSIDKNVINKLKEKGEQ